MMSQINGAYAAEKTTRLKKITDKMNKKCWSVSPETVNPMNEFNVITFSLIRKLNSSMQHTGGC